MLDVRQESAKLKASQRRHIDLKNAILEGSFNPGRVDRAGLASGC
jgi:hypothetical protein